MDLEGALDVLFCQSTTDARDALDAQCIFTNSSLATPHVQRLPRSPISMLSDVYRCSPTPPISMLDAIRHDSLPSSNATLKWGETGVEENIYTSCYCFVV